MTRVLSIVILLLLTGCAAVPAKRSVLRPWTWFNPNRAERVEEAAAELRASERELVKASQIELVKATAALSAAPESRPVEVARRTTGNAEALLAQAAGAVPIEEATKARDIALGLLSEEVARREDAEKRQAIAEHDAAELSDVNQRLNAELSEQRDKLAVAYQKERALADQMRRIYWIAGALVVLWLLGQVLSIAARVNPAFAGIASVANGVISPALSYAYKRAHNGMVQVREGMDSIRTKLPDVADRVTELMDGALDSDHKHVAASVAKPPSS